MKKKSMLEAMKKAVLRDLAKNPLLLLLVTLIEGKNKETGDITIYLRFDVEVPRGCGDISRCRFSVKVLGNKIPISEEALEQADYVVTFQNLDISYIDDSGNVYFKADDYSIKKEG